MPVDEDHERDAERGQRTRCAPTGPVVAALEVADADRRRAMATTSSTNSFQNAHAVVEAELQRVPQGDARPPTVVSAV